MSLVDEILSATRKRVVTSRMVGKTENSSASFMYMDIRKILRDIVIFKISIKSKKAGLSGTIIKNITQATNTAIMLFFDFI
jgi:hypothetical protein